MHIEIVKYNMDLDLTIIPNMQATNLSTSIEIITELYKKYENKIVFRFSKKSK